MTAADLDDLLRHAHERGEVVLYVPRTGRIDFAPAPAPGEPVRLYGGRR